jgi:outer membrane autotransporter protein
MRADLLAGILDRMDREREWRNVGADNFLLGLVFLGTVFMGQASHADGYKFTVNPSSQAPGFDARSASVGVHASVDATRWFGAMPVSQWRLGLYGGFVSTNTDLGATPVFGLSSAGSGDNRSFVIGRSSLVRQGPVYYLTTVSGNFGDTDVTNNVLASRGSFETHGVAVSGTAGVILPVSGPIMADLRGGITYAHHEGDGYTDSNGYVLNATRIEEWAGEASVTFFRDWAYRGGIVRPFIQTGIRHRFDYDHTISAPAQAVAGIPIIVNGYTVTYSNADTVWHIEGGVRLADMGPIRFNGAIRYDVSSDSDAISGRLGATIPLTLMEAAPARRARSASRGR